MRPRVGAVEGDRAPLAEWKEVSQSPPGAVNYEGDPTGGTFNGLRPRDLEKLSAAERWYLQAHVLGREGVDNAQ